MRKRNLAALGIDDPEEYVALLLEVVGEEPVVRALDEERVVPALGEKRVVQVLLHRVGAEQLPQMIQQFQKPPRRPPRCRSKPR